MAGSLGRRRLGAKGELARPRAPPAPTRMCPEPAGSRASDTGHLLELKRAPRGRAPEPPYAAQSRVRRGLVMFSGFKSSSSRSLLNQPLAITRSYTLAPV